MTAGTHACLFIGFGVERCLNGAALFWPQLNVHLGYVHKNTDFPMYHGAFNAPKRLCLGRSAPNFAA